MKNVIKSFMFILLHGVALATLGAPEARAQSENSGALARFKNHDDTMNQFELALQQLDLGEIRDEDVVRAADAYRNALQAVADLRQTTLHIQGKPWQQDQSVALKLLGHGRPDLAHPYLDRAFKALDSVSNWTSDPPLEFMPNPDPVVVADSIKLDEVADRQSLAEVLVEVGRLRDAKSLVEKALARLDDKGSRGSTPGPALTDTLRPSVLALLGKIEAMLGETAAARTHLDEAMTQLKPAEERSKTTGGLGVGRDFSGRETVSLDPSVTMPSMHEKENFYGALVYREAAEGDWAAARDTMDHAMVHHRNRRQRNFFEMAVVSSSGISNPRGSNQIRGTHLYIWHADYLLGLSLGLVQASDQATAAASAAWVVNGKRTEEDLARNVQGLFRLARQPETRSLVARWNANRAEAAATALGAGLSAPVRAEVASTSGRGPDAPTSPGEWLHYWFNEANWARGASFDELRSEASGNPLPNSNFIHRDDRSGHPDLSIVLAQLHGEQPRIARNAGHGAPAVDDDVRTQYDPQPLMELVAQAMRGNMVIVTPGGREEVAFTEPPKDQPDDLVRSADDALRLRTTLATWSARAGGTDPFTQNDWVAIDAVRSAISDEARLVEIVRFRPGKLKAVAPDESPWNETRYVAWVVPPKGAETVKVVDLGPALAIDEAVARVRAAVHPDVKDLQERGESEVEMGPVRERLEELSRLVLHPLLPHLQGAKRWIISPDGQLWLAPWPAMLLPDGRYAVEAHAISHIETGRDLVKKDVAAATSGPPVIFADPDFGPAPAVTGGSAPRGATFAGVPFGRLPGTAAEAKAIVPSLRAYARTEPVLLTGTAATERALRGLRSPRVLVLSTHGFSLNAPEVRPAYSRLSSSHGWSNVDYVNSFDPLALSGVVLAQANARLGADRLLGMEDGLVTASEVEGLDLGGTELVVLSACDTGLGQVRDGEGVAGLRQAFRTAGAKAVVAALWQVPDKESAQLMDDFFRRLATGARGDDALREAQLAFIKARRDRIAGALPFFWAAFSFTGR